jgi:hypothetical protein
MTPEEAMRAGAQAMQLSEDIEYEVVEDTVTIGPGCFAAADRSVINWDGVNYVPQRDYIEMVTLEVPDVDKLLGFDVNDFESATYYAIFNDPEALELVNLPEALRELTTRAALYEDESRDRTVKHARLMNEDRAHGTIAEGTLHSPVKVKVQTVLRTPWADVPLEDA